MRLAGLQPDYQLARSTTEPLAAISGVLPGQTVEFIVQGVNAGLQGVASDPILFTVPSPGSAVTTKSPLRRCQRLPRWRERAGAEVVGSLWDPRGAQE